MAGDFNININGNQIKVTKEVYDAYMQPIWREEKRRAIRADKERSFDYFEGGADAFPASEKLVEDIVADKILLDILLSALESLSADERGLVDSLFYQQRTEREIANSEGVSQNTIHYRKVRLLEKLKKILDFF